MIVWTDSEDYDEITPDDGGEPITYWWEDMRPREVRQLVIDAHERGRQTSLAGAHTAIRQIGRMRRALESLIEERLRYSDAWFRIMTQGPLDEIRWLEAYLLRELTKQEAAEIERRPPMFHCSECGTWSLPPPDGSPATCS